jgi:hypothetical protein
MRNASGPVHNKAQEERAAADEEPKKFSDTADFADKETWAHPAGHSGTRRAWAIAVGLLAAFGLGAAGLTAGPLVLLWIGVALFVVLGVLSVSGRVWSDFTREKRH